VRLHSAIGYVTPQARLEGHHIQIFQRWLGVRRPEFARAGNEDAEEAMLENALVESAAGRQKL